MVAYLVATVRISDPVRYAAYTSGIVGLAEKHGGESVVKGLVEEILEGEVPAGERVVVTRFPDAEAVRSYIASEQYGRRGSGRQPSPPDRRGRTDHAPGPRLTPRPSGRVRRQPSGEMRCRTHWRTGK